MFFLDSSNATSKPAIGGPPGLSKAPPQQAQAATTPSTNWTLSGSFKNDEPVVADDEQPLLFMRDYLWYDLFGRGLDADGYTDYFLSLLDLNNTGLGEELEQFLVACGISADDASKIVHGWRQIALRGSLSEEEQGWIMEQYHYYCSTATNNTGAPVDGCGENASAVGIEGGLEGGEDEGYEEQLEYQEVDWLVEVEKIEETLARDYGWSRTGTLPTGGEFSPEAIFYALAVSGNHIAHSAKLLKHAADVLKYSKAPCRHALQGKCLLRNCQFDHNFGSLPCRYWLFSKCSSDVGAGGTVGLNGGTICPFLHELPMVAWTEQEEVQQQVNSKADSSPNEDAFPTLSGSTAQNSSGSGSAKRWVSAVKSAQGIPSYSYADKAHQPGSNSSSSSAKYSNRYEHSGNSGFSDILASHNFITAAKSRKSANDLHTGVTVKEWVVSGKISHNVFCLKALFLNLHDTS